VSDLSPIAFEYQLACSAEHAFDTYANRIGEWWDPRYTADTDTYEGVTIEPGAGGRVCEHHAGGVEHEWGRVTAWDPGRRLVHSFALAQDPAQPSEVAVDFVARENGCDVRFAHGGWTEANVGDRKKFSDWPVLLDRFAELAQN
jgi:uncharacterized protein YndB with AHSA1/START domain